MLTTMENYLRWGQRRLHRLLLDPRARSAARVMAWTGSGFLLSGAGIRQGPQPLAMGLVCALSGWKSLAAALGAAAGYRLHWGMEGMQGLFWVAAACLLAPVWTKWGADRPLLVPVLAGVAVAVTGLGFLLFHRGDPFPLLMLRCLLATVAAWFCRRSVGCRDWVTGWVWAGIGGLSLAGAAPWLGWAAAGAMMLWASFPAAVLTGMGVDLAQLTATPVTAMVCLGWFGRMLPFSRRWMRLTVPAGAWLAVSMVYGVWDIRPLPGLMLGAAVGYLLPSRCTGIRRRGERGLLQVRLELTAGMLSAVQQLLLETSDPGPDPELLLEQAKRVCLTCVSREGCQERHRLGAEHLLEPETFPCRRPYELQQALQRGKARLRELKAERQRRQECRMALAQQYQFLAAYLRQLSDQLPRREGDCRPAYRLEASARSRGKERTNGDRCMAFSGTGCRYYLLLCDGMGTGLAAAGEGETAAELLKRMLTAGFPPEHALRSVNSLLVLREMPGAITVDLAEIRLDSGRVSLYKWGAAPSWVLSRQGLKKIGTAGPPPGIWVTEAREEVVRLSLRAEESLILVSDGVEAGECLHRMEYACVPEPGELARRILEEGGGREDDATAVVIRLRHRHPST